MCAKEGDEPRQAKGRREAGKKKKRGKERNCLPRVAGVSAACERKSPMHPKEPCHREARQKEAETCVKKGREVCRQAEAGECVREEAE